jgi:RNA polymerase sigma factor (TIGR02999 family)
VDAIPRRRIFFAPQGMSRLWSSDGRLVNNAAQGDLGDSARAITMLLNRVNGGGEGAFGQLVDAVYDDLRRVAAKRMRKEFDGPLAALTESPTAVVHQAVLKLREQRTQWKDADHFFAIATRLLGYVISDYKKQRMALKRGQGRRHRGGDGRLDALADHPAGEHLDQGDEGLDAVAVIQALHEQHPRQAEVVTLHVIAGRSMPDVARLIGMSLPTAERDWKFAKAWIRNYLDVNGASM